MKTTQRIVTALAGVLALTVPAAPALAVGASPPPTHFAVAEAVIDEVPTLACDNGEFTACFGGNAERTGLPSSATNTPNSCIERNDGDFNACNVGNSGRGDLPYRRPSR